MYVHHFNCKSADLHFTGGLPGATESAADLVFTLCCCSAQTENSWSERASSACALVQLALDVYKV